MAERTDTARVWTMRALFVALAGGIAFLHLIPLDLVSSRWPAPDLMLAFACVWALRRPVFVPVLLVAGVFLLADLLFQRPPGLWAALVVMAVEWLKRRARLMREALWTVELLSIAGAIVTITLVYRAVLLILFVPLPSLALTLIQLIFTCAALPVVMLVSRYAFGLYRAAPGEVDRLGHRL